MSEILTAVLVGGVISLIGILRPDWYIKPLMNFMIKHVPKYSNLLSNWFSITSFETGVYLYTFEDDSKEEKEEIAKIQEATYKLKEMLRRKER
jgi:hypothetical protein